MDNKDHKKVFVIEDEPIFRKMLSEELGREGFFTLESGDGADAIKVALEEKPGAILLDLMLPVVSGVEVLKKIRAEGEWGRLLPIIIFTNLDLDDPFLREIIKNQPSYYLMKKDSKISDVVSKVKECFKD